MSSTGKRKVRSSSTNQSTNPSTNPSTARKSRVEVSEPNRTEVEQLIDTDVPMNEAVHHDPWRMLHLYSLEVIALHTRLVAKDNEIDYHAALHSAKELFSSINQLPVDEQIDSADSSSAVQSSINTLVEKLMGKHSHHGHLTQSKSYTHQRTSLSFMTAQLITKCSSYQIPIDDEEFAKAVIDQTKQAFAPQIKQMREAGLQTNNALASFESALRTVFCNNVGHSQLERHLFLAATK